MAAILFLVCPPILVNTPPAYTVEPDIARAKTGLSALGS